MVSSTDVTVIEPLKIPRGSTKLTPDVIDKIIVEYLNERGSLVRACRNLALDYRAVNQFRKKNEDFQEMLKCANDVIADEIHGQFVDRVLDRDERNPTWKIFWMKNNMERYADNKEKKLRLTIDITDSTISQPKPLTSKTMKALKSAKSRPSQDLDPTADTS